MSVAFVVQKAIRNRLIATSAVTDLVPATGIKDSHHRPIPSTAILIGEAQTVDLSDMQRGQVMTFHDLHVWVKESNLTGCNAITGEVRSAIHEGRLILDAGYHCADTRVSSTRLLRDPDGETSHGIVTVETVVQEVAT